MTDVVRILSENLRETLKAIERFLLLGLTASLVLIALASTDRTLSGAQRLMFTDMNAPAVLVAIVALGAYFASGAFAAFHFRSRSRLVHVLIQHDRDVLAALLTYPSVVAKIAAPQIIALAFVGGLGMVALVLFYAPTHETEKALLAAAVIGSPYILLLGMAIRTVFTERRVSPPGT